MKINRKDSDENLKHIISDYYAKQFSKTNIITESDYLVSAIFTDYVLTHEGLSGVYYPSIHSKFGCFNIAIKPETVDKCLQFSHSHECTIYKDYNAIFIDIDKIGTINSNGIIEYEKVKQSSKNTAFKLIY